jgi:hypothetical protein
VPQLAGYRHTRRLLLAEPAEQRDARRTRILDGMGANAGFIAALVPEFAVLLGVPGDLTGDPPPD